MSFALPLLWERWPKEEPVVVSQDGRPSGEMIKQAVLAGLTSVGCKVVDAGIASTPTCGVLIKHLNAQAGLQITASHNPIEWNGLKPFFVGRIGTRCRNGTETDRSPRSGFDELGKMESTRNYR